MVRASKYVLCTLREKPSDADIVSNKLMLRAGMIRKLSSGVFTWLPIGLRVIYKLNNVIRKEMLKAGGIELFMPAIQPINIWKRSGRLKDYSSELIKIADRNKKEYILGPTHEEVITELITNEAQSFKYLPLVLYQIQTHFRDEIRPRFGVIRTKEFLMKDAYSFHINQKNLKATYRLMYKAYVNIFNRIGLKFKTKQASSGFIGNGCSHEFHALSKPGENDILYTTKSIFISNTALSDSLLSFKIRPNPTKELKLVIVSKLKRSYKPIKAFIVHSNKLNRPLLVLIIRGDQHLNRLKLGRSPDIFFPLRVVNIEDLIPLVFRLPMTLAVDRSAAVMSEFIASINISCRCFYGVNWERSLPLSNESDISGHVSKNKSILKRAKSIEIGHIFQVGTKYSASNESNNQALIMGCYGIGVSRTIATIVEQSYDKNGSIWSNSIAPFQIAVIALNMYKLEKIKEIAEHLYNNIIVYDVDTLLDDRAESLGVMFNDIELIGINHIILVSNNILFDKVEYKNRFTGELKAINKSDISSFLVKELKLTI